MEILSEVRKLKLPAGEYIVVGSGILGALNIRPIDNDIDLLVSEKLFDDLLRRGWDYDEVEIEGRMRPRITSGTAEAFKDFWYNNKTRNVPQIIAQAQFIDGIPFLPLEQLREIKLAFNRPKDLNDIALIDRYLAQHPAH